MPSTGTYVYCLVVAARRPSMARLPAGLAGLGRPRLLDIGAKEWLVVADAPLSRFGEAAINRKLSDLEWVSRAAVAHESIVESFIDAPAVLPMKLFTIFMTDERAVEHVRSSRARVDAAIRRVKNHQEWGVRIVMDRAKALASAERGTRQATRRTTAPPSGLAYLTRKKAQRDASAELAQHARERIADVYERLAKSARIAKRRLAGDMPAEGGALLLDAAFLVPTARAARFRSSAAREARALEPQGYGVTLTGPWPPYSFIQD